MTGQDNFAVRFAKHKDELEWLFMELYHNRASLDVLGGEYHTPEGTSVWLADVELEPYQALLVHR